MKHQPEKSAKPGNSRGQQDASLGHQQILRHADKKPSIT
jgi:hypothetical protein